MLTGYLPAAEHVIAAKAAVARVRAENPAALYVCDPVFGDEPGGLYLDEATADAIGQHLIPLCDVATPNLFELAWLADKEIDDLDSAFSAARLLDAPRVLATSVPAPDERLATLLVHADTAHASFVPRRPAAPHGTGGSHRRALPRARTQRRLAEVEPGAGGGGGRSLHRRKRGPRGAGARGQGVERGAASPHDG